MIDANAALPPRFVFALFGRRRAGKSVMMAALRAVRRPQIDGVRISYVGTLPPILHDNSESMDDAERKRIEAVYIEASDALSDGRVPDQTAIADGIMGHRFELTLPSPPAPGASVRLHVDIYDYAGELLAITQDDETAVKTLHGVLRDTDGLLILAETPMKGINPAEHRESLSGVSALGEALSRLGAEDRGELRQAVLLATKWDHQHPFDCKRADQEPMADYLQRLRAEEQHHATLFANWLTTDPAAEQHHLLDTRLRALFGSEEYRSYPVSAFGKARFVDIGAVDGTQAEVPAVVPLASLNLDEPILFLVARARARQRRDLLAKSEGPAEAIGPLPDRAALVALHGEDTELLALRDQLAERQEQLALERAASASLDHRRRTRRKVGLGVLCAAVLAGGAVWLDATRTMQTETAVQDLVSNAVARKQLEAVISARDALFDLAAQRPMLPTVRVLGLGYPPEQQAADLTALTATECELWADRAQKPDFDIEQGRMRLETLPGCGALDGALRTAHLQGWKSTLRSSMDGFRRLTAEATCSAPDFVESSIAEMRNKLMAHLDAVPEEARDEARQTRDVIDGLEEACRQTRSIAIAARASAAARDARDKELKKLDFVSLQKGSWADYVKGLADFSKERDGAPAADLDERTREAQRRLGQLVAALEKWSDSFPKGQAYDRARSEALARTEEQISALPAHFESEKKKLLATVTAIKTDLEIWEACSDFRGVNAIYSDISGNLGSRTEARKQDLRNAIAALRAKGALRDHVSAALDEMEGQIDTIMMVKVDKVLLKGTFPGENDDEVAMKWQFHETTGSEEESQNSVDDNGNFELDFFPKSVLPTADDVKISVKLADTFGLNSNYELEQSIDSSGLLTGTSGLKVTKPIDDGNLSRTDWALSSKETKLVKITLSFSGPSGPIITPTKCGEYPSQSQ